MIHLDSKNFYLKALFFVFLRFVYEGDDIYNGNDIQRIIILFIMFLVFSYLLTDDEFDSRITVYQTVCSRGIGMRSLSSHQISLAYARQQASQRYVYKLLFKSSNPWNNLSNFQKDTGFLCSSFTRKK